MKQKKKKKTTTTIENVFFVCKTNEKKTNQNYKQVRALSFKIQKLSKQAKEKEPARAVKLTNTFHIPMKKT